MSMINHTAGSNFN